MNKIQRKIPLNIQLFADSEGEGVVTTTETVDTGIETPKEEVKTEKEVKTYSRDDVNKMIASEKAKLREEMLKEAEAQKTEAEKLASMKTEEKLQYELEKERKEKAEALRKLSAKDLKDEALKIATNSETKFDVRFLDLIDFENIDADKLNDKTKLIKSIFDGAIESAINEYSKEPTPQTGEPTKPDVSKMTYSEMVDYLEENPNAKI